MLQPESSVAEPFTPRMADEVKRQMRHSVYLEEHAEHYYQTLALMDLLPDTAPEWSRLPEHEKTRYRTAAEATINRHSEGKRYQAQLRAREHVATSPYGPYRRDFSGLPLVTQTEILRIVETVVDTYTRALEGVFTPLPAFRAAELEPSKEIQ